MNLPNQYSQAFSGSSSIGGTFLQGGVPADLVGTYLHADYTGQWIRKFKFDNNEDPAVGGSAPFYTSTDANMVFVTTHPQKGGVYYVSLCTEEAVSLLLS